MVYKVTRHPKSSRLKHQKWSGGSSFVEDPKVWIDAIGVPRGVPDEFKAKNQISAGFVSCPLLVVYH